jgi:hypothetical protein
MIVSIARASDVEWDAMVDACPTAIYVQTREWFEIWSEYGGFINDPKLITFDNGKKVLLPLTRQVLLGGLLTLNLLSPRGMGGFVTNDTLDETEKRELFGVLRGMKRLYARLSLYDPLSNSFQDSNAIDSTQVMDLSRGFEATFGAWRQDNRRQARRGLSQGISVSQATSEADWRAYYDLYEETRQRWGAAATNAFDWSLFQIIRRRHSPGIRLWLARSEGQPIAGALCLYHSQFMIGWHTAKTLRLTETRDAFHVLQYFIVQDACARGFQFYDFLGSGADTSIERFKSGFAAQFREVRVYRSPFVQMFSNIRKYLRRYPFTRFLVKGMGS